VVVALCESHGKKIEAFCDLDKKILCIDCILNENHKNHEILSTEKACQKQKHLFEQSLKSALNKESEVSHQILRIKSTLLALEETANTNRTEVSRIFNEVRNRILEREIALKKHISETLEKESIFLK
jgi:predicted  nucleic acid-binding Zn-ribbon protein